MLASKPAAAALNVRRRTLRPHHTQAETILWRRLQGGRLHGHTFRRRHAVGPYVLDFYCPDARLAVALDGATPPNDDGSRRNVFRTAYLAAAGVRMIRFEDRDVARNLERVLASIARCCAGQASRVHILSDDER